MRPSTCRRRLSILVLLISRTHTGISLALPHQPAITPPPIALPIRPRADADFLTTYGFFDSPPPEESSLAGGSSALAHIPEVFMAMAQETGLTTSTFAIKLSQTAPLTESAAMPSSTVYPSSPPMLGPGLVVLSTPVLPTTVRTIPAPTAPGNSNAASIANRTAASRRMVVLGSVIGSILLFTLFLFFLLDPSISSKVFRLCCKPRKSRAKKVQREKATAPAVVNDSWVSVVYIPSANDQAALAEAERHNVTAQNNEIFYPVVQNQLAPPSKFSVCSSVYIDSPRDSVISSAISSETSTVKPLVSFAPGQSPVRPPRPPTADSPALTDSVYLACSDKPYVIVAPGPFSQIDLSSKNPAEPPKRNLTPSEFFALHVPGLLASLSSSTSWGKKAERTSLASGKRASHVTKRETRHSRTRSEPLVGFPKMQEKSTADPDYDYENDSDVQGAMIQRLMKHRRSRSASGWAYPDRPKSRRQLNS